MPELPEVETIRRQLTAAVIGKTIKKVEVSDPRIIKGIPAEKFAAALFQRKIKEVRRRGKALILVLDNGWFVILHLRISGWLILDKAAQKHSRAVFVFSDSNRLHFCDSRVLGEVRLVEDLKSLALFDRMGPEPFDLKKEEFAKMLEGKAGLIKPLLMDQHFIAGVGNIYAQEALFCARIGPARQAKSLTVLEREKLHQCLVSCLNDGIKHKGSSVDTFRHVDGAGGSHADFLRVYQKEGKACPRCKTAIKKKTIAGRGTCFCPACQK